MLISFGYLCFFYQVGVTEAQTRSYKYFMKGSGVVAYPIPAPPDTICEHGLIYVVNQWRWQQRKNVTLLQTQQNVMIYFEIL
jgi:hypothetical protein